jgi:peptide/nickel transport system ATP-binding protein/oligopeptide transport system ATP-binding protein
VGQSGSGKSTLGKTLVRLAPLSSGSIWYDGLRIDTLGPKAFFPYRKRIQMVFQDPWGAFNPRMTVRAIVQEPLDIHFAHLSAQAKAARVAQLLSLVGLEPGMMQRYPQAFSGGQRQRIGIARALAVEPQLLVCDEPVSALDVSVQGHIINLLADLQAQLGLSYLFIGHDLAVVRHLSHHIAVMHQGRIVEYGPAQRVCQAPCHPYTQELLAAVP